MSRAVVVTRPAGQGEPLAARLVDSGHRAWVVPALAIEPLHLKQHGAAWIELPRIRQNPPDEDPRFTRAAADHRGGILSNGLRSSPDQTAQQKQQKQHQRDAADRP